MNAQALSTASDIDTSPDTGGQRQIIVVRRARAADLAELARELGSRKFFKDRLRRQKRNRGRLFVAELDGKIVGTVYLRLEQADEETIRAHLPDVPLLTHLEVKKRHRRKKVGTALVGAVERQVAILNKQRVALALLTDNVNARRLYEKLGYKDWDFGTVQCHKYNRPPDDLEKCDVMVKQVATAELRS